MMSGTKNPFPVPPDVQRFILLSIPSVPYLEALLLLRKERHRVWSAREVAQRLYIGEPLAAELLAQLQVSGITAAESDEGSCRYAAASELEDVLAQVEECYAKNLVDVTALVHSKSGKRAQQFADAFKLRKDS